MLVARKRSASSRRSPMPATWDVPLPLRQSVGRAWIMPRISTRSEVPLYHFAYCIRLSKSQAQPRSCVRPIETPADCAHLSTGRRVLVTLQSTSTGSMCEVLHDLVSILDSTQGLWATSGHVSTRGSKLIRKVSYPSAQSTAVHSVQHGLMVGVMH